MLGVGENSAPVFASGSQARLTHAQFEQLHSLSRSVLLAGNYPDLFKTLADFSREVGAGAVNCAVFDNTRKELVGVSTTMNASAVNRYFEESFANDDPLIPRIRTDPRPALLGWGFGVTEAWQSPDSARMLPAMEKDGYYGLAYFPVPVAGSAFSTSVTFRNELEPERGQAFLNSEFGLLQLAADIVGHRAAQLFQDRFTGENWHSFSRPTLTPREREILVCLASGLRTDKIAHHLQVRPVTVHMHIRSVRRKLGARTREQMMARAALRGLF